MQEAYDSIAAYYDLEHAGFRDDIAFYSRLLDPGPILEIGVGTGRIARALAETGFEVWGIDSSSAMLERAKVSLNTFGNARLWLASALDFRLERTFPTALLSLNTLWHFPDPELQKQCLQNIRTHLEPGGLLVVDSSNPLTLADRGSRGEVRMRFSHDVGGTHVVGTSAAWDDEDEQRLRLELVYDTTQESGAIFRHHGRLELRYVFLDELLTTLESSGLFPRQTYGSYDLDPYDDESKNLIVVALAG